jgi:Domain of unknown function (DUF4203)
MWIYYSYVLDSNTPVWLMSSVVICCAFLSYVVGMLGVNFIKAGVSILSCLGAFIFCYILVLALPIFKHTIFYPLFMALISLPGLGAGFFLPSESLIVSTSLIGSFCIARGVSIYTGYFPNELSTYKTFLAD